MQDKKTHFDVVYGTAPAAKTSTVTGTAVDLSNFNAATVVVVPGTITDGTHTPSLLGSPDNVTFTAVPAANLVGSFAVIATGVVQRVGYIGAQRYIRCDVTVSGATTGGVYGVAVVRSLPHKDPVP